jgi:cobalt-zinc-cadmium efflux system membrane fusion protein
MVAVFASLLCGITIGCRNTRKDVADKEFEVEKDTVVSVVPVSEGFLNDELILNGKVMCDESKMGKVFIPCSGKVQRVTVEVGDYVVRGQLLAKVFSQDAASYEKQLSDINTEIRLAQRELSMKTDLHSGGMASDKDVEEAQSRVDMAMAEKNRLQSVARVNGFSSKNHAAVQSPMSGYVFSKNVYNGSYIDDTNNDAPAFEIADLGSVWIVADVYESDIRKIRQDAKVYVTVLAYPGESVAGSINKIYRCLDGESKTMKVRVKLDNSHGRFLPGMFASVHVLLPGAGRRMIRVPAESVIFENGNNYVVVAGEHGRYHRKEVKVAYQDGHCAYIESGVDIGEHVVDKNAILEYNTLK